MGLLSKIVNATAIGYNPASADCRIADDRQAGDHQASTQSQPHQPAPPSGALGDECRSPTGNPTGGPTEPRPSTGPLAAYPQGPVSSVSPVSPCPRCDSRSLWRDQYHRLRCQACDTPRDFRWVRGLFALVQSEVGNLASPWVLEEMPGSGSGSGANTASTATAHQIPPQGTSGGRRFTVEGEGVGFDGVWVERIEPAALHPWGARLKLDGSGKVVPGQMVRVLERAG